MYTEQFLPTLEGLDVFHDQLEDAIAEQAADQAAQGDAVFSSVKRTALIVTIVALLLALALAFVVVRSVTRPVAALGAPLRSLNDNDLQDLSDGLTAVSSGDLTISVAPVTEPVEVNARPTRSAGCRRRSTRCSARRRARSRATTRCASSSGR